MLNTAIKNSIDQSVLCWLATVDAHGQPNVSPKEMFTYTDDGYLVIANIASPNSIKNIRQQPQVCVSFVDIFVQKGFQLKGKARIVKAKEVDFAHLSTKLKQMAGEAFPFKMLIAIQVESVSEIIAPRYRLYPDTTEAAQIESAMRTYGVQPAKGFE